MHFAYDLDGVLADTKRAIEVSYNQAGIFPPADFWGKPWKEWLWYDPEAHEKKNEFFAGNAHLIKPLPIFEIYCRLGGIILTGASKEGAAVTLSALAGGLWFPEIVCGLTAEQKADELNKIADTGIMFEDSLYNVNIIRERTAWKVVYVGQY